MRPLHVEALDLLPLSDSGSASLTVASWSHSRDAATDYARKRASTEPKVRGSNPLGRAARSSTSSCASVREKQRSCANLLRFRCRSGPAVVSADRENRGSAQLGNGLRLALAVASRSHRGRIPRRSRSRRFLGTEGQRFESSRAHCSLPLAHADPLARLAVTAGPAREPARRAQAVARHACSSPGER
jgi:hypothetical protein